mgnify:CR=1 FL=1
MTGDQDKTYEDAGYNRFFRRTLSSNISEKSLKNVGAARAYKPQDLNFDDRQASGSLGDVIRVGSSIELNGQAERISIKDTEGNEVTRLGNMES